MRVRLPSGEVIPKPVAIEVLLGDALELANQIGVNFTPGWVSSYAGSISNCSTAPGSGCKPQCHPNWGSAGWREQYYRFVKEFGKQFDGRVAAVIIGTGFDREATETKDFPPCYYGGDTLAFTAFVREVIGVYNRAFPTTPQFLQDVLHGTPTHCADMASFPSLCTGEKLNGLEIDTEGSRITWDGKLVGGVTGFAEKYRGIIPIGFEPKHDGDGNFCYWMGMELASLGPDFVDYQKEVVRHTLEFKDFDTLGFLTRHIGVNCKTTPDVWMVLRETKRGAVCWPSSTGVRICYGPYSGDYGFYLTRSDTVPQSKTVATAPNGEGLPAPAASHTYSRERGRRTDQASGSRYMSFNIADCYALGTGYSVAVVFLDRGTDTIALQYRNTYGSLMSLVVQKTGTNQWRELEWRLTDAVMDNSIDGNDFRIDCGNDGDEWIHRIILRRR
jgi:hypothetical protein